jgi:tetratricopeptide (TPR) repeat protein
MSAIYDFSQAIYKLNKDKKFSEALKYFKEHKTQFTPEQIGANKYIVYEVLTALIELSHFDIIFNFIDQYKVILEPKNFSFLLKKFKDKPSINWSVVNRFCDLVSPEILDTECKTIEVERKGQKKQMELASNKEDWYSFKTKALFETKNYEECFNLSKIALNSFSSLHYSNEIWFARKIALCKKHLGKIDEAISELQIVLRKKKEWFIQKELAELFFEQKDYGKAFELSLQAMNNFGDLDFKIDLLVLIGKLLELKDEKDLAFKHYSLSKLLRLREDGDKIKWNVPFDLQNKITEFAKPEIQIDKLGDLKIELKKYWKTFDTKIIVPSLDKKISYNGKIDKILHKNEKGIDGFIKSNEGKTVYFSINSNDDLYERIEIGKIVEFNILPAVEGKKEKAVKIKLI